MILNDPSTMKLDLNDLLIQPAESTNLESRSESNPYYDGQRTLPIFVSPMDTVVSSDNYMKFLNAGMNVCLPRGVTVEGTGMPVPYTFVSYSLNGIIELIKAKENPGSHVLIDIANGHMSKLFKVVKTLKDRHPEMQLMVGNIANPKTYALLSIAGADYIRVGIGNGAGCLTTQNTGVGYPMASLISECYDESLLLDKPAKIVADGGMREYSDIIKSLALGADYVMLGSILNKCIESSGQDYLDLLGIKWKISNQKAKKIFESDSKINKYLKNKLLKKFRGMSTKEVQKKWGRKNLKTSEGVVRWRAPEYTINKWTENCVDYLKSNMTYTNSPTLDKFIGKVNLNVVSYQSYKRFNK